MSHKRTIIAGVLATSTALTLSACAGTSSSGPAATKAAGGSAPAAPGWDPASKTITINTLYPTSGPFANTVQDVIGLKAYFRRATLEGGPLAGYKVNVSNQDTQFATAVAIPQYQRVKGSTSLFGVLSANIAQALPLKQDQTLVLPADFDSKIIHNPNFLPFSSTYEIFTANAVSYAAEVEGKKDVTYCSVLMNGPIGDETEVGTKYAVQKLGLKYGISAKYTYPITDVTPLVVRLRDAKCGEVIVGGVIPIMQLLAARADQLNFAAGWIAVGTTISTDMATGAAGAYMQKNVKVVYTGGDWGDPSVQGAQWMAEDVKAIEPSAPPAVVTYETGYVSGIVMAQVLKKALANGDMSRDGLIKASNEIGKVDMFGLGGGSYDYGTSPETRKPPRAVTIYQVSKDLPAGLKAIKTNYTSDAGDTVPLG